VAFGMLASERCSLADLDALRMFCFAAWVCLRVAIVARSLHAADRRAMLRGTQPKQTA
jgi:hypothetical protein